MVTLWKLRWIAPAVVSWGGHVAARTNVVGAIGFEVSLTATLVAGKKSGVRAIMGGARNWLGDWGGDGGGGTLLSGSSTFHKGSSNPGSKSRKVPESGVSDIKGRRAGMVVWW